MEDPERKWDHFTPPTRYSISIPMKFWQLKWVFQKVKGIFKKR